MRIIGSWESGIRIFGFRIPGLCFVHETIKTQSGGMISEARAPRGGRHIPHKYPEQMYRASQAERELIDEVAKLAMGAEVVLSRESELMKGLLPRLNAAAPSGHIWTAERARSAVNRARRRDRQKAGPIEAGSSGSGRSAEGLLPPELLEAACGFQLRSDWRLNYFS
jgi:hypothetical protein